MPTWLDRFLDLLIKVLAAPFDYLQQRLGREDGDEDPYDPTLWL